MALSSPPLTSAAAGSCSGWLIARRFPPGTRPEFAYRPILGRDPGSDNRSAWPSARLAPTAGGRARRRLELAVDPLERLALAHDPALELPFAHAVEQGLELRALLEPMPD